MSGGAFDSSQPGVMQDPSRHSFGTADHLDVNPPHDSTRVWHERKAALQAQEAAEMRELTDEFETLKRQISRKYDALYKAAAQQAGFQ